MQRIISLFLIPIFISACLHFMQFKIFLESDYRHLFYTCFKKFFPLLASSSSSLGSPILYFILVEIVLAHVWHKMFELIGIIRFLHMIHFYFFLFLFPTSSPLTTVPLEHFPIARDIFSSLSFPLYFALLKWIWYLNLSVWFISLHIIFFRCLHFPTVKAYI